MGHTIIMIINSNKMKIIFSVLSMFIASLVYAKDVDVVFSGYKSPYVI